MLSRFSNTAEFYIVFDGNAVSDLLLFMRRFVIQIRGAANILICSDLNIIHLSFGFFG